ncbi:hypothetical protein HDU84_007127, partial [Entophlyctis sp. JEL0112]
MSDGAASPPAPSPPPLPEIGRHQPPSPDPHLDHTSLRTQELKQQFLAACASGDTRSVSQLLAAAAGVGDDPAVQSLVCATDPSRESGLHKAALHAHVEVVGLLLANGADARARDADGYTPLHNACASGDEAVVRMLVTALEARREPVTAASQSSTTTTTSNTTSAVAHTGPESALNPCSRTNATPLMCASARGHILAVSLLLHKLKAVEIRARDDGGDDAFACAAMAEHVDVCRLIFAAISQSSRVEGENDAEVSADIDVITERVNLDTSGRMFMREFWDGSEIVLSGQLDQVPLPNEPNSSANGAWFWMTDWAVDYAYVDGTPFGSSADENDDYGGWRKVADTEIRRRWIRVRKRFKPESIEARKSITERPAQAHSPALTALSTVPILPAAPMRNQSTSSSLSSMSSPLANGLSPRVALLPQTTQAIAHAQRLPSLGARSGSSDGRNSSLEARGGVELTPRLNDLRKLSVFSMSSSSSSSSSTSGPLDNPDTSDAFLATSPPVIDLTGNAEITSRTAGGSNAIVPQISVTQMEQDAIGAPSVAITTPAVTSSFSERIRREIGNSSAASAGSSLPLERSPVGSWQSNESAVTTTERVCGSCFVQLTSDDGDEAQRRRRPRDVSNRHSALVGTGHSAAAASSEGASSLPATWQSMWTATRRASVAEVFSSIGSQLVSAVGGALVGSDEHSDEDGGDGSADEDVNLRSGGTRSASDSAMLECPVCGKSLLKMLPEAAESHVGDCLKGGAERVLGRRYVVQTLYDDGGECIICFEDMVAGDRVARLNCLCVYHEE